MSDVYVNSDSLSDIGDSIRAKLGVETMYKPSEMSGAIDSITTGVDTSDATAISANIMIGKTAYVNGNKITGTMDDGENMYW